MEMRSKRKYTSEVTRRRGLAAAGTASGAAWLAACGADTGTGAREGAPAAGRQPVTLRWSTWGDGSNPMVQAAAQAATLFKQRLSHVTVVPEAQINTPGGPSWTEKNFAEWVAGNGPDLSGGCCATLPDWGHQGLLQNLDPLIKRDGRQIPLTDYVEAQLNTWKHPSRGQFALPMYMGTMALYYNRSLFRQRGVPFPDATWDWGKWQDALVRVARPDAGQYGWFVSMNFPRPGIYVRQNGGWQVDPKDNTKAVWDTPQALNALQWLHDRMWKDRTLAKQADLSATGLSAYIALSQGKLAMLTEGSWILARWVAEAPDTADQWDMALLPKGPAQRDTAATIDGWGIWTGSKHQEESWELVKFLQNDQWWELAVTIVGHQPARKSWMDRYVQLTKKGWPALADKNLDAFTEGTRQNYARPEQFFKRDADSKKVWTDTIAAVFTRNERPVADAFRDAARQVNAINAG